jgi:MFS family permease
MSSVRQRARVVLGLADFRVLLGARLTSQLADGVFQGFLVNELVFLSPEEQSTTAGVAVAFAILVIPFSLVGPFTGVVIDRWSRRAILTWIPVARAAAAVALIPVVQAGAKPLLYVLALVVVSANRFFLATAGALLPSVVPDEDLLVSNSFAGAAGTVVTFLGLFLATQLADTVGSSALLAVAGILWPICALSASRLRRPFHASHPDRTLRADLGHVVAGLARGARRILATPAALGPMASLSLDQFLFGVITVVSVVVFREELGQGVASYGRILGAGGVGLLVGMLTVPSLEDRMHKHRIVAASFALTGAVALLSSVHVSGPVILILAFTIGLTYPFRKVPSDTLIQQSMPDRYRGRVFALYDMAFSMPRVVAAAASVLIVPRLSTGWLVAAVGLVYLAWSPVLPWWIGRPRWIRIRFYAGGRADELPRAVVIGGEEESVDVLASWLEEERGIRRRRFRLAAQDGSEMEVVGEDPAGSWRLVRQVQEDLY